jgi:hypothetical protein
MRNGGKPGDLLRRLPSRTQIQPHAQLDVQKAVRVRVADLLLVPEGEDLQVGLERAAVGDRAGDRNEVEGFLDRIDLQDERLLHGETWFGNDIESVSDPVADQVREQSVQLGLGCDWRPGAAIGRLGMRSRHGSPFRS